jgi:hypothetical protein
MEILRAYAGAYVCGAKALALVSQQIHERANDPEQDIRKDAILIERMKGHLSGLFQHCEHLPATAISITRLLQVLDSPGMIARWTQAPVSFMQMLEEIQSRLQDELSLLLFFKLPPDQKKRFENPQTGWEEVVSRFPDSANDIEEMNKCYALSRFAASVFHCVQAIELGLIQLGIFLGVKDPKSGWTAVTGELDRLVKVGYKALPRKFRKHFSFLEQTHGTAKALQSAWRNKISHAQGRLVLMTSDFGPQVAEEIMIASRSFMRRLATEMP